MDLGGLPGRRMGMDGHLQIDMDEFLPLRDVVFNTLKIGRASCRERV